MTATLDFAALDSVPLRPSMTLPGLEHPQLPEVLAAAMPGVRHSRARGVDYQDEHSLVDTATGSAARIIIAWHRHQHRARTRAAEIGPRTLWDELVGYLGEWERHSRTIPEHWQTRAQRTVEATGTTSGRGAMNLIVPRCRTHERGPCCWSTLTWSGGGNDCSTVLTPDLEADRDHETTQIRRLR